MGDTNWCPSDMTRCRIYLEPPSPPPPPPPPRTPHTEPSPSPPKVPSTRPQVCSCTAYANLNGASQNVPMCQKYSIGSCMPAHAGNCPGDHFFCLNVFNPPPPAVPPLSAFPKVALLAAALSTTFSELYTARHAIDGDLSTLAVTSVQRGNWLSVKVAYGTPIEYVAFYNRIDLSGHWAAQLGTLEVWISSAPGDTTSVSAVLCGTASYRSQSIVDNDAYVVPCHGVPSGGFVTIKQTGQPRYLTIAEVEVY